MNFDIKLYKKYGFPIHKKSDAWKFHKLKIWNYRKLNIYFIKAYQGIEIFHPKHYPLNILKIRRDFQTVFLFAVWVFFHEHSGFTWQQGKGEGIYLTPLYNFHPLNRHLDITRVITAESSPLHITSSRTRIGNHWFPSASG